MKNRRFAFFLVSAVSASCSSAGNEASVASNSETHPDAEDASEVEQRIVTTAGCSKDPLKLVQWPLSGANGRHWFCNNFVDLDSRADETADYKGITGSLARTYDGHDGIDISIANFRRMDSNGAPVVAAAEGEIIAARDGEPDREQLDSLKDCNLKANRVIVKHKNGFQTYYGHLKRDSIVVKVGDHVEAGAKLGIVGSSGCSTRPHLHFEVQDCDGLPVDGHRLGVWATPPEYEPPSNILDVVLKRAESLSEKEIIDPRADHRFFPPGGTEVSVGLSVAVKADDRVEWRLKDQSGALVDKAFVSVFDTRMRNKTTFRALTLGEKIGNYTLQVLLNPKTDAAGRETSAASRNMTIKVRDEYVVNEPLAEFQATFDELRGLGYDPVWFDIYDIAAGPQVAAVFKLNGVPGWRMRWNLSEDSFKDALESLPGIGRYAAQIDMYRKGSSVRYALLEYQGNKEFRYLYGKSRRDYQTIFDANTADRFRPANVAVTSVNDATFYTALFDKTPVGSWQCRSNVDAAEFETLKRDNANLGRTLSYVNAFDIDGSPRFNLIFDARSRSGSEFVQNLNEAQMLMKVEQLGASGLPRFTRFVAGYQVGTTQKFAGLWEPR